MSWEEFAISPIKNGEGHSFEIEANLDGQSSSDWYIIPSGVRSVTVTITPSKKGGSAVVQTTTDLINNIKIDDFEVSYIDWTHGYVSSITCDVTNNRVNALRCVCDTGSVRFTAVC